MAVFVQFSDSSKTRVVAEFGCAQDDEACPHQGAISEDDPLYVAFLEGIAAIYAVDPDAVERAWRDAEIVRVAWVRDRHRDEVELAIATTITAEQYAELLAYIRALRDWPAGAEFPAVDHRPLAPTWIAEQTE
ncbi:phage tail assembly chaperone [Pseudomonas azerbaijanoccidens]|uniref:phage tail assembly chaperone n=1 Tax=Pseudomonas azerbaijanoccidentalis TaxID=2842347 RepID=UPI00200B7F96|nr:phage tail assembly chaperone [Pseudomonas azerbaijanoccidentalis]MCK8667928.1 phage tail assembly chaperone [Pseudomonas azerbaijanoccidentalis]